MDRKTTHLINCRGISCLCLSLSLVHAVWILNCKSDLQIYSDVPNTQHLQAMTSSPFLNWAFSKSYCSTAHRVQGQRQFQQANANKFVLPISQCLSTITSNTSYATPVLVLECWGDIPNRTVTRSYKYLDRPGKKLILDEFCNITFSSFSPLSSELFVPLGNQKAEELHNLSAGSTAEMWMLWCILQWPHQIVFGFLPLIHAYVTRFSSASTAFICTATQHPFCSAVFWTFSLLLAFLFLLLLLHHTQPFLIFLSGSRHVFLSVQSSIAYTTPHCYFLHLPQLNNTFD